LADAYLNIAEAIISAERQPMRPRDIIQRAYLAELLPWHLHGPRQDKTLHARLSEDIARSPEGSRFYRTAPGIFFLNEFRDQPDTPDAYNQVYRAPPRRRELKRDKLFSLKIIDSSPNGKEVGIADLQIALNAGSYEYIPFQEAKANHGYAVVHSFVVVYRGPKILSFRCGKFFPESDPIYGRRSIGIGSAVIADNLHMLYDSLYGIVENGIGELGYGVGLPRRLAERARYQNELRPHVGILLEDDRGGPITLHVVMGYHCPDEFEPSKAALSVNDLRWIDSTNPGNDLADYDATSRLLFERHHLRGLLQGHGNA